MMDINNLQIEDFGYTQIPNRSKSGDLLFINNNTRMTIRVSYDDYESFMIDKIDYRKRGEDLTTELYIKMIKYFEKNKN